MTPAQCPTNLIELRMSLEQAIAEGGLHCSLNHIDVSRCHFMQRLFSRENPKTRGFNGDISQWDVGHVVCMDGMFEGGQFNGDISQWNVAGCQSMVGMFKDSAFDGDLSRWTSPINDTARILDFVLKTSGTFEKLKLPVFDVPVTSVFQTPWRTETMQPEDRAMLHWLGSQAPLCRYHWDLLVEQQDTRWQVYRLPWVTPEVLHHRASLMAIFESTGIIDPLAQARLLDEGWRRRHEPMQALRLPKLFDEGSP